MINPTHLPSKPVGCGHTMSASFAVFASSTEERDEIEKSAHMDTIGVSSHSMQSHPMIDYEDAINGLQL